MRGAGPMNMDLGKALRPWPGAEAPHPSIFTHPVFFSLLQTVPWSCE